MSLQPLLLAIPSLIYIAVGNRQGERLGNLFAKIGWQRCPAFYFLWGTGLAIFSGALGALALSLVPQELFDNPNVNVARYATQTPGIITFLVIWLQETVNVVLGEEIFFRGLLGGVLMRRFGFAAGNTAQALVFLAPHLLLLLVSLSLWLLILVQLLLGWLLGWLRFRSGSIWPGLLAHSLANVFGAIIAIGLAPGTA